MVYSLIQGSYELNKDFIIENFCINKAQPELKCDGKCFLSQQLNSEKEKQEQNDQYSFSVDFGQFIFTEFRISIVGISSNPKTIYPVSKTESLSTLFFESPYTPPQA
nr:hypothetical protein [Belliella filtrata]